MTHSIDVVVLAHNQWEVTERCLGSLRVQTVPHTLIVADNGSSDGTPERVRTAFPEARVIELGANLGFAVANNRGVAAGSAQTVVLLNNDVVCKPDFLERLVAALAAEDRIGSVTPLLLQPGEQRIESFGLAADPTLAGVVRFRGLPAEAATRTEPVLVGPTGAAAAYRREAWEAVGGLDEGVFIYSEDLDLALRLRAAGWQTAAAPTAVAVHIGSASVGVRSNWQRYQGGFARGYFLRRYGVLRSRHALRAATTEGMVVLGDSLVFSHDLAALRGRVAGWRAARGKPRKPWPPPDAIDESITFLESLRLRFRVYTGSA